jgi:hypothetical protein
MRKYGNFKTKNSTVTIFTILILIFNKNYSAAQLSDFRPEKIIYSLSHF